MTNAQDIERLRQAIVRQKRRNMSLDQTQELFEQRLRDVHGAKRIHAEIQIIYHYELNPVPISPRVICSSKSACFLCNLFAQVHRKFYIARTHGRLYENWKLPATSALDLTQ